MYNMAVRNMGLTEQLDELRHEIKELYEFVEMQTEKETNRNLYVLNKIAFILLPLGIIAGILGMNLFETKDFSLNFMNYDFKILYFIILLIIAYPVLHFLIKWLQKKQ